MQVNVDEELTEWFILGVDSRVVERYGECVKTWKGELGRIVVVVSQHQERIRESHLSGFMDNDTVNQWVTYFTTKAKICTKNRPLKVIGYG